MSLSIGSVSQDVPIDPSRSINAPVNNRKVENFIDEAGDDDNEMLKAVPTPVTGKSAGASAVPGENPAIEPVAETHEAAATDAFSRRAPRRSRFAVT